MSELTGVFWACARISGPEGVGNGKVDEVVDWLVEDSCSSQISPALKCLPSKGLSHLCYAAVSRIIPSDEPQGASLFCFDRCNVLLLVRVLRRSGILDSWSNEGVMGLFFDLGVVVGKMSAQEPQDFFRLCLNLSYMAVTLRVALYYAKIFLAGDIL